MRKELKYTGRDTSPEIHDTHHGCIVLIALRWVDGGHLLAVHGPQLPGVKQSLETNMLPTNVGILRRKFCRTADSSVAHPCPYASFTWSIQNDTWMGILHKPDGQGDIRTTSSKQFPWRQGQNRLKVTQVSWKCFCTWIKTSTFVLFDPFLSQPWLHGVEFKWSPTCRSDECKNCPAWQGLTEWNTLMVD